MNVRRGSGGERVADFSHFAKVFDYASIGVDDFLLGIKLEIAAKSLIVMTALELQESQSLSDLGVGVGGGEHICEFRGERVGSFRG
jgi:hypothetical protein